MQFKRELADFVVYAAFALKPPSTKFTRAYTVSGFSEVDSHYITKEGSQVMDVEKVRKSLKPVKELITQDFIQKSIASETPLQKLFDNRKGPEVEGGHPIDYHVFSPVKENDSKRYPVFIWLHGMSQGNGFRQPVQRTEIANFASPEYQAKFGGAYIVVPRANEDLGYMATEGQFWYTHSWISGVHIEGALPTKSQVPELKAAINQFLQEENSNIDSSRIYISGFSAGGYMTWQMLLAMPNIFAATAPICHAMFVPTKEQLASVSNIPMWVICGEKDELCAKYVLPTIESLRHSHKAELRTTLFETVLNPDRTLAETQHHSWTPVTFDMFYNDGKPYDENYPKGFIKWLASHKL